MNKPQKPKDGGPAFPREGKLVTPSGKSYQELWYEQDGMSLRDYFAGQEVIHQDEHFEWEVCEALAGPRPTQSRKADPLAWEKWYATWRAEIRYLRADAMLRAREQKEGER